MWLSWDQENYKCSKLTTIVSKISHGIVWEASGTYSVKIDRSIPPALYCLSLWFHRSSNENDFSMSSYTCHRLDCIFNRVHILGSHIFGTLEWRKFLVSRNLKIRRRIAVKFCYRITKSDLDGVIGHRIDCNAVGVLIGQRPYATKIDPIFRFLPRP